MCWEKRGRAGVKTLLCNGQTQAEMLSQVERELLSCGVRNE